MTETTTKSQPSVLSATTMIGDRVTNRSGENLGKIEELTRDEYLNIPVLEEELRTMKKQWEDLHALAQDTNTFKGDVNIQGHKEVQFRIIKRVMYSCASAGYSNINFAVLSVSKADQAGGGAAGAP